MKKIVHISTATIFLKDCIELMNSDEFKNNKHIFYLGDSISSKDIAESNLVQIIKKNWIDKLKIIQEIVCSLRTADKIILHGLFIPEIIVVLFFMPWILDKCYWVIWGADLYEYKNGRGWKNIIRFFLVKKIVQRVGHIISYIEGDYINAINWFDSKAKYHNCLAYTSNLFNNYQTQPAGDELINVMIGHSAAKQNNHIEIFGKLQTLELDKVKFYVPLSYGDKQYREEIIKVGGEMFGDRIIFLTEVMPFDEYIKFLGKIDVVIFNHPYQFAMGNTITLLGLGKKVFIRSEVTQWKLFSKLKVKIFDVADLKIERLSDCEREKNKKIIEKNFSYENYVEQWKKIINYD